MSADFYFNRTLHKKLWYNLGISKLDKKQFLLRNMEYIVSPELRYSYDMDEKYKWLSEEEIKEILKSPHTYCSACKTNEELYHFYEDMYSEPLLDTCFFCPLNVSDSIVESIPPEFRCDDGCLRGLYRYW